MAPYFLARTLFIINWKLTVGRVIVFNWKRKASHTITLKSWMHTCRGRFECQAGEFCSISLSSGGNFSMFGMSTFPPPSARFLRIQMRKMQQVASQPASQPTKWRKRVAVGVDWKIKAPLEGFSGGAGMSWIMNYGNAYLNATLNFFIAMGSGGERSCAAS